MYLLKLSWPKQRWATGAIRLAKLINEMWNINLLSIVVNRRIPILEIFIHFLLSFVLPLSCLDAFCLMLPWKVWLCRSPRRAVAMPLTLPISKSQRQLQIQSLPAEQRAVQLRSWVQIIIFRYAENEVWILAGNQIASRFLDLSIRDKSFCFGTACNCRGNTGALRESIYTRSTYTLV